MPSVILLILSGLLVCSAAPRTTVFSNEIITPVHTRCRPGRPNCRRAVLVALEPNTPIPKVDFQNGDVSASFGGYQASAGLGGSLAGGPSGGLHAEASIPGGTGASAGLGGSVGTGGGANAGASVGGESLATSSASSGASVGNRVYVPQKPRQRPPDYYDNIFNIPISVLQAVNQLLGGGPPKNNVGVSVQSRTASSSNAASGFETAAHAGTSAQAGTSAHAGTSVHAGTVNPVGGFFDQIFNIPISALRSVNQFLNAKNQQTG